MAYPRAGIVVVAGIVNVIAPVLPIALSCQPARSTRVWPPLNSSIHSSSALIAVPSPLQSVFFGLDSNSFNKTVIANGVGVTVGVFVGIAVGVLVGGTSVAVGGTGALVAVAGMEVGVGAWNG